MTSFYHVFKDFFALWLNLINVSDGCEIFEHIQLNLIEFALRWTDWTKHKHIEVRVRSLVKVSNKSRLVAKVVAELTDVLVLLVDDGLDVLVEDAYLVRYLG